MTNRLKTILSLKMGKHYLTTKGLSLKAREMDKERLNFHVEACIMESLRKTISMARALLDSQITWLFFVVNLRKGSSMARGT